MLQNECSELKVVGNGKLACGEFAKSGPYGVVILDVHMPIMGGKEAAATIRRHDQAVPIIFLTGELASELQGTLQESMPCKLLMKPCAKEHLLEVSSPVTVAACLSACALRVREPFSAQRQQPLKVLGVCG